MISNSLFGVITMVRLTYTKRVWIVKQYKKGISASKLAMAQKIHRSAVYQVLGKFEELGWEGLKDHKTGRPEVALNPKVADMIIDVRKKYSYGACCIEQIFKRKGFSISHRQIDKVLVRNNLVIPNIKKQKPRKWVRYELPNPNDLWHTDWTYDPFTTLDISAYEDDRTRLIVSYGRHKKATTEISLALLKSGIAEYGKPKSVMTDHGTQYYNSTPDIKGRLNLGEFQQKLKLLGIKHYIARVNRPQTNGKIERFFLSYKIEFATGSFTSLKDYIKHYNKERPHMSLGYRTPVEVWNELKNV